MSFIGRAVAETPRFVASGLDGGPPAPVHPAATPAARRGNRAWRGDEPPERFALL